MKIINKSNLVCLLILVVLWLLFASGTLGSNVDICEYRKIPNSVYRPLEFLGGFAVTLTINNIYVGVYLVSFFLVFSSFYYIKLIFQNFFKYKNTKKINYYSLVVSSGLFLSWPFYNFFTNAIRQSVAITFLNLILILSITNNKNFNFIKIIFLLPFLYFSHRSANLLMGLIIYSFLSTTIINRTNLSQSKSFLTNLFLAFPVIGYIYTQTSILESSAGQSTGYNLSYFIAFFVFIIFFLQLFQNKIRFEKKFLFVNNLSIYLGLSCIFSFSNEVLTERLFIYFVICSMPYFISSIYKLIKLDQRILTLIFVIAGSIGLTVMLGPYRDSFQFNKEFGKNCINSDRSF